MVLIICNQDLINPAHGENIEEVTSAEIKPEVLAVADMPEISKVVFVKEMQYYTLAGVSCKVWKTDNEPYLSTLDKEIF
jgi:hypothetical protein